MKRCAGIAVIPGVLLLAACASAPTRFYTLLPQSSSPAVKVSGKARYRISVLPVGIPAQDDQPQLVVRESNDRVALLEGERWAAPLGDLIRVAVSDRLSRDLDTADVYGLPRTGKEPVYRIKLDVRRFESVVGRYALIAASWSVRRRDRDADGLSCTSTVREPVAQGYDALVRGHQQALAVLSDRIARATRSLASGSGAGCP